MLYNYLTFVKESGSASFTKSNVEHIYRQNIYLPHSKDASRADRGGGGGGGGGVNQTPPRSIWG